MSHVDQRHLKQNKSRLKVVVYQAFIFVAQCPQLTVQGAVNLKIIGRPTTTWRETISSGGISLLSEMIYSISLEKMSNSWRSAGMFSVATPSPSSASALPRWANKANLESSIKKTVNNKCLVSGRLYYYLTKWAILKCDPLIIIGSLTDQSRR